MKSWALRNSAFCVRSEETMKGHLPLPCSPLTPQNIILVDICWPLTTQQAMHLSTRSPPVVVTCSVALSEIADAWGSLGL